MSGPRRLSSVILLLIVVALSARLGGIFLTEVVGFNPFAQGQHGVHAHRAGELSRNYFAHLLGLDWLAISDTETWARYIGWIWLLPGPSQLFAQVLVALVGVAGVLNVYWIATFYHSRQAGVLAAGPVALLPSYVLMHSALQREAAVLFFVTTAFVLVFLPFGRSRRPWSYGGAIGFLVLAGMLRNVTLVVYAAIVVVAVATWVASSKSFSPLSKVTSGTVTGVAGIGVVLYLMERFAVGPDRFARWMYDLRDRRARARAAYLVDTVPASIGEFLVFSWVGALYFLFAPFPWHLAELQDLYGVLEGVIGLVYAGFGIYGVVYLKCRAPIAAVTLVVAIGLFAVLFGFGTGNYGTAIRHRQTIFWAVFVLGAMGMSTRYRVTYGIDE